MMMKLVLACALALLACVLAAPSIPSDSFAAWAMKHGKSYNSNELEYRMKVFAENTAMIDRINAEGRTYTLAMNQYGDMTWEEFQQEYLITTPQECSATVGNHRLSDNKIPDKVDWREAGIVTDVKDQGGCGSCWTFSTTGCLESVTIQKTGKYVTLSEQQLIDCAGDYDNHGCKGGLPSHAFEYIHYNGGIDTEDAYPYQAKDLSCRYNATKSSIGATVAGVVNITEASETELTDALGSLHPVAVAFQVVSDFRFYSSGVYQSDDCKSGPFDVNHAVLAVGYDLTGELPYYIVKNSWNTSFGMNGYFNIVMGKNMCGIATCASYPTL